MALRSALVDQGYLHRGVKTAKKVGGRSLFKETEGPMFRVRLDVSATPQSTTDGMIREVISPRLLTGKSDSEGNPLEFKSSDVIRVISGQLGEELWEVQGDPEPLRKRRSLIGWQLNIQRIKEQSPEEP